MNLTLRRLNLYLLASLLLFLPACSLFESNIKEIDSLSQANSELASADQGTLVVFDMDDTLIEPEEKIFHLIYRNINDFAPSDTDFIKQLRHKFEKIATEKNDSEYLNKLTCAVFAKTKFIPVEQQATTIVKDLQTRGIKVVALTASNAGRFIGIERMEKWRQSNLNQVGLDFSASFNVKEIIFDSLKKMFGFYPVFYNGILCAAGNPKGKVLAAFFEKIGWKPKKVIFFDDGYHHCKSVSAEMMALSLPVQCFWYRAAYKRKIKLDHDVVKAQLDHWIEHEEFLNENEVREKMYLTQTNTNDDLITQPVN